MGKDMTIDERNMLIKQLMFSKDHFERGLAVLKRAGYGRYTDPYMHAVGTIETLRADIFGLQTGQYPKTGESA